MPSLNQDLFLFYYLLILYPYYSLPSLLSSPLLFLLSPLLHIRSERGRYPTGSAKHGISSTSPCIQAGQGNPAMPCVYYLCVSVCACMSLCVCTTCPQVSRTSEDVGSLKMESQAAVSHLMRASAGNQTLASGRAFSALSHGTVSLWPLFFFLLFYV